MNFMTLLAATVEQTEAYWAGEFFGLDQNQRFALVIIAISCSTAIIISLVAIISGTLNSVHRRREVGELKRELLDRGMSAEEIVGIVEAAPPQHFLDRLAPPQKKR